MHDLEPARPADAAAIARVEAAAAFHPWSEASVRSSLDAPTGLGWVVRAGDAVVGHLLATAVLDEGEILTVAVHPAHQRRGLAGQLVETCLAAWTARGVVRGFLEVRADNAPARALYARAGFREVGLRRGYYAEGGDAVLLAWTPTA